MDPKLVTVFEGILAQLLSSCGHNEVVKSSTKVGLISPGSDMSIPAIQK